MPHRRKKKTDATGVKEFVTVAFAEDVELAQQYKKLLNDRNIPAAVRTNPDSPGPFTGVAVMVPEEYIDEAHLLIESEGACDTFFDMVFHDSDDYVFDDEESAEDF